MSSMVFDYMWAPTYADVSFERIENISGYFVENVSGIPSYWYGAADELYEDIDVTSER
jgi:hypothetical protein